MGGFGHGGAQCDGEELHRAMTRKPRAPRGGLVPDRPLEPAARGTGGGNLLIELARAGKVTAEQVTACGRPPHLVRAVGILGAGRRLFEPARCILMREAAVSLPGGLGEVMNRLGGEAQPARAGVAVSYTHLRAHET